MPENNFKKTITEITDDELQNKIYIIRNEQVMLDSDLAELYGCVNGAKTINLAVKRHLNRFPSRFMFQLTADEYAKISWFQTETLKGRGHNAKYPHYAFTEQGVAMLATILRTKVAEEASIRIIDTFVMMHKYMSSNLIEQKYINHMVLEHDNKIDSLQKSLDEFSKKQKVNEIYFNGQIYDAYSKIQEIFNRAKTKIVIIDNYANEVVLNIIKKLNVSITIVTKANNLLTKQDIANYNSQYHNLRVVYNNTFHDRYFIIDDGIVYHCGASINAIGRKTFSINLLEDGEAIAAIINKASKILS